MLEHARPRRIGRRQPVPAPALANDAAPTPPDAPPTIAPLLPAQRRLWLLQRLFPGVAAYVVPIALQLEGRLDEASLQRALDALVERHPALRTTIVDADGTLVQRVSPAATLPLTYPRLRRKTTGRDVEGEASAPRLLVGEALRAPFDLEAGPLVRAQLVKRAPRSHLLLLLVHRLVCDDDSIRTLIRDLGALYRAFAAGLPNPLPPLPIAAHEIAAAEHAARDGDAPSAALAWWRTTLAGVEAIQLPTDRAVPSLPSQRAGRHPVAIPADVAAPLIALGAAEDADPFTTALAAYAALLGRMSGSDDLAIGTPASIRPVAAAGVVGQLSNTLVLRVDLAGDPTFRDLIRRARQTARDAFAHAATPFEQIVDALNPERSVHRTPLAPVAFALRQGAPETALGGRLEATLLDVDPGASFDDLRLDLTLRGSAFQGWWQYSFDLFEPATIARLADRFGALLRAVVADPDRPLSAVSLLTEAERRLILEEWNPPASPLPKPVAIDAAFQRQAAATPAAPALQFDDAVIAYDELARRSADLARILRQSGVTAGMTVGVCLDRTPLLPAAMLAILEAGGVCLPLDPAYPAGRLAFMLDDAGAALIVTDAGNAEALPANDIPRLRLDLPLAPVAVVNDPAAATLADMDAAYLVYTSGSTGVPKGVVDTHRGAVNLCRWLGQAYPFVPDDVCAYLASPSFVDTIWDLFGPLLNGAATVVVPNDVRKDPERLIDLMAERRVTRLLSPPSMLRAMLDTDVDFRERTPALRLVFSTAETLAPDLVERIAERIPQARLVNTYGSSETTAVVTTAEVGRGNDRPRVPIGRPIANSRVYILDAGGGLAPVGVPGALAVGGAAAAAGYLRQPALTAATFGSDPFAAEATSRLVRTGDRGRWLNDGTIELLGRADRLVKVRGFRVEPGEVESALTGHPAVRDAAVVARSDGRAGPRLVAYLVARGEPPTASDLRAFLRRSLPEFMIPAHFVVLPEMPRTPTGKLDRRALPTDPAQPERAAPTAPRTPTEAALAAIWEQLLDVRPIGVDDNFFDLGGQSLLVVRTMTAARDALGVNLPARTLFESPTIAELATRIDATGDDAAAPADAAGHDASITPLNQGDAGGGIFLVPGGAGEAFNLFPFAKLFRRVAPDRPAWGFIGREQFSGVGSAHDWVRGIAARYVRELRAHQTDGPYVIVGACAGGNIAFEVAQQLHAAGARVDRLILMDVWHPDGRDSRHAAQNPQGEKDLSDELLLQARLARRGAVNPDGAAAGAPVKANALRADARETVSRRFWLNRYVPEPYPLPITLLVNEDWHDENPTLGWDAVAAGGLDVIVMAAEHGNYLGDHFEETAGLLRGVLDSL